MEHSDEVTKKPSEDKKSGAKTSRLRKWMITSTGLLILVVGGFFAYEHYEKTVYTEDAFIDAFRVNLSPDVFTGRIVDLTVDEGYYVKKGEVVAIQEQDILISQKNEAQAFLLSAKKQVNIENAQFIKLSEDYGRALQAIKDKIISIQAFEHVQQDYGMAQASYEKALADQDLAEKKIDVIDTYLHHTYIYSPCNGIIAKRWVFTGDVVRPGQALFSFYDSDNVWVQANLSERKIEKVRLGDRVEIHVDAYPDRKFYGNVFVIKAAAASQFSVIPQNNATGNYTKVTQRIPIKISLETPDNDPNTPLYLFPGMNVEVTIHVKK